ncbi:MAG TPA: hypothetical protein VF107_07760 [Burkholderiaceae bacterium]
MAFAAYDIVVGQVGPFTGIPVPDAPQLNQGMKVLRAGQRTRRHRRAQGVARNNIGSGFVDIGVVNADGRLIY